MFPRAILANHLSKKRDPLPAGITVFRANRYPLATRERFISIQEFPSFHHSGNEAEMTKEAFAEDGGYILIPDRPGIGVELVGDITERFPPKPRSISAQLGYDGAVCDIQEEGRQYHTLLRANGVETSLRCFPESRHGFLVNLYDEWQEGEAYVVTLAAKEFARP